MQKSGYVFDKFAEDSTEPDQYHFKQILERSALVIDTDK